MRRAIINTTIRILLRLLARVRAPGLDRVPVRGPLIIAMNHINFLEVPLIYLLLKPRRAIGLTKAETWDKPMLRVLANLWEAIPIRRSSADTAAFRRASAELCRGSIVIVAPEGTRSGDGRLRRANAGVVTLAARTGAPVLPVAHHGGEAVWSSLRRGRRTIVTVRFGRPVLVPPEAARRSERERYLSAIMGQIAAMLPPAYRGHYAHEKAPGVPGA